MSEQIMSYEEFNKRRQTLNEVIQGLPTAFEYLRKATKENPIQIPLDGFGLVSVYSTFRSYMTDIIVRENERLHKISKYVKKTPTAPNNSLGFKKPAKFQNEVIAYYLRTLRNSEYAHEIENFISLKEGAGYGVMRHSQITTLADICAKLNGLQIADLSGTVYRADPTFKQVFSKAIECARDKDLKPRRNAKGEIVRASRGDYTAEHLKELYLENKNKGLNETVFNPDFFIHSQHSKLIECTKDPKTVVIDDLELYPRWEYDYQTDPKSAKSPNEMLEAAIKAAQDKRGPNVHIILTSELTKTLSKSLNGRTILDAWRTQDEALDRIRLAVNPDAKPKKQPQAFAPRSRSSSTASRRNSVSSNNSSPRGSFSSPQISAAQPPAQQPNRFASNARRNSSDMSDSEEYSPQQQGRYPGGSPNKRRGRATINSGKSRMLL